MRLWVFWQLSEMIQIFSVGETRTALLCGLTSLPVVQALRWTWSSHHDDHTGKPGLFGWWHCHFTIKVNRMITKKLLFPFVSGHRQWLSITLLNLFDNIFSCNVALQSLIAYRTKQMLRWCGTKPNQTVERKTLHINQRRKYSLPTHPSFIAILGKAKQSQSVSAYRKTHSAQHFIHTTWTQTMTTQNGPSGHKKSNRLWRCWMLWLGFAFCSLKERVGCCFEGQPMADIKYIWLLEAFCSWCCCCVVLGMCLACLLPDSNRRTRVNNVNRGAFMPAPWQTWDELERETIDKNIL